MSKLPKPTSGKLLFVKERQLKFSYWPAYQSRRHWGLNSSLFISNPWALMNSVLAKDCDSASRAEASALLDQAEFFYKVQENTDIHASKALLTYYCFLNLAKSLMLLRKRAYSMENTHHGLSEKMRPTGTRVIDDAFLRASISKLSSGGKSNAFDELLQTLAGTGLTTDQEFDITALLPQIVMGHRLWCEATGSAERFINIAKTEFYHDDVSKTMWMRLSIFEDDLKRFDITHDRLLAESGLAPDWKEVKGSEQINNRRLLCFEQNSKVTYLDYPLDFVHELVDKIKSKLWSVVTSLPPYRQYYLYLCPSTERPMLLPQILSSYAVMYYLGSITRYRPHHFRKVTDEAYGAFVQELLSNQPDQILYLLASEFAQREVTKPAVI